MNRLTRVLTLLLAVQLGIVIIVFWPGDAGDENQAGAPLLEMESAGVERIVIADSESSLVLSRAEQGWILPEHHGLPADPGKITAAVKTLPALSRGWPVAQTQGARQRFEVATDTYQRKVQYVNAAGEASTLYLGTSPGFRKVHARLEGEDAIYAVEFNTFDLPVSELGWLDKTLLQVAVIDAVAGLDYEINRDGETWVMADGETADPDAVQGLVNGLQSLRVIDSVDIATAAILRDTEVPPTLTVSSGADTYEFRLYEIEDEHYIKRSDIDIYFSVSALDYDRLNDVDAAALLGKQDAGDEEMPGDPDDAPQEFDAEDLNPMDDD